MIRKKDLDDRLTTGWTSDRARVSPVRALSFDVPGSCMHAYSGSEPGAMALLMTDSFDPSEWLTEGDIHLDGTPVAEVLQGFGHGDWRPGHVQYVRFTARGGAEFVNDPVDQPLFPGGQFAAETYGEPTSSLQCTSQGAWPEVLIRRVLAAYPDREVFGPLRTARVAQHSEGRILSSHDVPWGFPFGSAESESHLLVGMKYAAEDRVVDRLFVYRRDDLARGPVAEIRSRVPDAMKIRLGLTDTTGAPESGGLRAQSGQASAGASSVSEKRISSRATSVRHASGVPRGSLPSSS
jgi:hypothetical protein